MKEGIIVIGKESELIGKIYFQLKKRKYTYVLNFYEDIEESIENIFIKIKKIRKVRIKKLIYLGRTESVKLKLAEKFFSEYIGGHYIFFDNFDENTEKIKELAKKYNGKFSIIYFKECESKDINTLAKEIIRGIYDHYNEYIFPTTKDREEFFK